MMIVNYDARVVLTTNLPWSPSLVVMGRDSRSEGRGFKSQHRILDGHFFTYICCKNCNVCLKRPKINEKEAGIGPLLNYKFAHKVVICDRKVLYKIDHWV